MNTPPASKALPRLIEPRKLALQGAHLEGVIELKSLERLAEAVNAVDQLPQVMVTFTSDDFGAKLVRGEVELTVRVPCQRCLNDMALPLRSEFAVAIVWTDDEAEQLPKHLEPWLVPDFEGDLHQLVEEEILLALPMVSYHDPESCQLTDYQEPDPISEPVAVQSQTRENPFSVLEQLKRK